MRVALLRDNNPDYSPFARTYTYTIKLMTKKMLERGTIR